VLLSEGINPDRRIYADEDLKLSRKEEIYLTKSD
jgi:hypothetical protein